MSRRTFKHKEQLQIIDVTFGGLIDKCLTAGAGAFQGERHMPAYRRGFALGAKSVAIIKGLASYIPGIFRLSWIVRRRDTGGTISARYCYSVWLRHLVMAFQNGFSSLPKTIAELGPGDSLGTGLAGLISGADRYFGLDVVRYANTERDLEILNELLDLFATRESIPGNAEFPGVKPKLESYEFPEHILTGEALDAARSPSRIKALENALANSGSMVEDDLQVRYLVPWHDLESEIEAESVDMIFSQAVLEYADDLADTYGTLHRWLKPGGLMSHRIDLTCHDLAREWNGHWTYTDSVWRLIVGARPYAINREPHSIHIDIIRGLGFEVIGDVKSKNTSKLTQDQLAPRFRGMSTSDLTTSGAFIQAVKIG